MSTIIEIVEDQNLVIVQTTTGPPGPPGSNLTDGDKGDINVAGNGSSWLIKTNAVTLSKLGQINTGVILGRSTSGSGNVEALSAASVRFILNVANGATSNQTDSFLLDRTNHTGTQTASTISDFAEAVDDRVNALLVEGANVTLTYDDVAGTITIDSTGGTGTGVTDGDKGDIVVSGTGTTWLIDNNVVTYAKMQDVTTARIMGRNTAGTGDMEELTAATVRTMINVANGATANSSDATLLARANHTGTQAISTITNLQSTLDSKVDENAGGFVTISAVHPGSTITIAKDPVTGFWPASYNSSGLPIYTGGSANAGVRPTSRTDVVVIWKGADPSPGIVSSGTGGMLDNVDVRYVTP